MNGSLLLIGSGLFFLLSYVIYGRYLTKIFEVNDSAPTPAHTQTDGIDYVPTASPVLFGHHFASIAGAGPIVGPVLGAVFGWVPVALWIILGCVLIGAVHDFSSLIVSIRHEGRSIGHILEGYLSYSGRQMFLLFSTAALILVIAIFALLIAQTFITNPAVASASVMFMALALVFGLMERQKILSLGVRSAIFVPLMFAAIYAGIALPLDWVALLGISAEGSRLLWIGFLFIYIFIASVAPVWILLQPRDYLNSFLLYAMLILAAASIFVTAPAIQLPAFSGFVVAEPTKGLTNWSLFPILYVTIACGACSGFHALVSSGTTAKQLNRESHALPIGYGAMLLEGILAIIALISVAILNRGEFLQTLSAEGPVSAFSKGIASLSVHLGLPITSGQTFISLTISAFLLTTLDTATRLTRFTVQELAIPRIGSNKQKNVLQKVLSNRYLATVLVLSLAGYLTVSGDAGRIWPVFGASNQLLAALTLLGITVILIHKRKNFWVTFIPFVFMMVISGWALIELLIENIKNANWLLAGSSIFLLAMSLALAANACQKIRKAF